jgi:hypothetical protein
MDYSIPPISLSLTSHISSPVFTNVDSIEMRSVAVTSPSLPLTAAPDLAWGKPGSSMLPSDLPRECRPSGLVTSKVWSLPVKIG